jgi:hypothetical protein
MVAIDKQLVAVGKQGRERIIVQKGDLEVWDIHAPVHIRQGACR